MPNATSSATHVRFAFMSDLLLLQNLTCAYAFPKELPVRSDFRVAISAHWQRYKKGVPFRHEQRGARSLPGGHLVDKAVLIGIGLFEDEYEPLAAGDVNAVGIGVVGNVVGVSDAVEF